MSEERQSKSKAVYVLILEDDRYYVGATADLEHRVEQHESGQGAEWTADHSITDVRVIVEDTTDWKRIERELTLRLMETYGWRCVRGGPWSGQNLDGPPDPLSNMGE